MRFADRGNRTGLASEFVTVEIGDGGRELSVPCDTAVGMWEILEIRVFACDWVPVDRDNDGHRRCRFAIVNRDA